MATAYEFEDIFPKKPTRLATEVVRVPSYDVRDVLDEALQQKYGFEEPKCCCMGKLAHKIMCHYSLWSHTAARLWRVSTESRVASASTRCYASSKARASALITADTTTAHASAKPGHRPKHA